MADSPVWTDVAVAFVAGLSWEAGREFERARIAEAADELDAVWRSPTWRSYYQQVADRRAEMQQHARTEFPGGLPLPSTYVRMSLGEYRQWCRQLVDGVVGAGQHDHLTDYQLAVKLGVREELVRSVRRTWRREAA